MKLKMTISHQVNVLILPIAIILFLALIGYGVLLSDFLDPPAFLVVFFKSILFFLVLQLLIIHLNYVLYEKNRSYEITDTKFILVFKKDTFEYTIDQIKRIELIYPNYAAFNSENKPSFFNQRSGFTPFKNHYKVDIVLENEKRIPITNLTHPDIDMIVRRHFTHKKIVIRHHFYPLV